jgi:lipopolysaccharide heptosyltransferase II
VAEVAVVTKTAYAEIFSATKGIDRVVAYDPRGGFKGLSRIAREFRDRGYLLIDAHNNWRSRMLSWKMGGASARFNKHYGARLGLIVFKRPARLPTILEQYGALAEALGVPPATLRPGGIEVPDRLVSAASEHVSSDRDSCIAVAPGAKWPMKRWPRDHYLELCRRLIRDRGLKIILMGDANDRDVTAAIAAAFEEYCIDITGRTSFLETAGYLRACAGFVGNDSGLMHLSEAVGVPVVGLFGPTVEAFGYYPALSQSKTVERDLSCRPCSRNGGRPCPKGTQECLTGIDVDTVETAVLDMLANAGKTRRVLE